MKVTVIVAEFASIPTDGKHRFVYDSRYGHNRVTVAGVWMKRRAHWGTRGAVFCISFLTVRLDMLFIRCTEQLPYLTQLAVIMVRYADLLDVEFTTHSLNYVTLQRRFGRQLRVISFLYQLNKKAFEHYSRLKATNQLFVNWQCVDFFDIPPARGLELFVEMPEWLECYQGYLLLNVPTPVISGYYANLVLSSWHKILLLRVAIAKHSVFCVMAFVAYALYCRSCAVSADFCGVEDLFRGGILLPLSQGVLLFLQDVGFFGIIPVFTFNISQAYLAFHRTVEVDWSINENVGWLLFIAGDGIVSDTPARKSRGVSVLQMMK